MPAAITNETEDIVDPYDLRSAWLETLLPVGRPDDDDEGDEGADDDADQDEDDDDGAGDGADDDDESGDDDGDKDKGLKPSERKRLSDEAKKYRRQRNDARSERDALRQEIAALKESGEVDGDGLTPAAKSIIEGLQTELLAERIKNEVSTEAAALGFDTKKTKAIQRLLDMDEVEVDEDGIHGVRDALEALAEEYPEWLVKNQGKGSDEDDEDDEDDGETKSKSKRSGRSATKKKKGKSSGLDEAALKKRFPALQAR